MKQNMAELLRKLKFRMPKPRSTSLLYNRWVLYAMFVIALVNLYLLAMSGDYKYVAVFILSGFLASFFSKNMMVILFIAVALTNILKIGMSSKRFEGMENKDGESEEEPAKKEGMDKASSEEETETETPDSKKKDSKSKEAKIQEEKDNIIEKGKDLLDVQAKIVDGFQQIDPFMKKAEGLASEIEKSATYINNLNNITV
jgi:hypothetical protein